LLEGLWIDDKRVHVFLATTDKERFTIVAEGLAGVKPRRSPEGQHHSGNIILDVVAETRRRME
jgi:hypothetical protein